jgi:hypothetical protein
MSTGMTEPSGQHIMDRALFDTLFTKDTRQLGPAISSAKQTLLANGNQYEETSETFMLFGDPAMSLKIPLPSRPRAFDARVGEGAVTLSWEAATDSNGNPVVGYNVYRSTTSGGPYTKLNTELITETTFTDNGRDINVNAALINESRSAYSGLAGGATYYYVVTSVDEDGDESVASEERGITVGSRAVTPAGGNIGPAASTGGSSGGGCFINTVLAR